MPSGKIHDSITFFLAVPAWLVLWRATGSAFLATLAAIAFMFGGLMFGPDLDTRSVQYSRWGPFKILWLPYRTFFKHRSFWTHGLLMGTLLRIVYFLGVVTILIIGVVTINTYLTGSSTHGSFGIIAAWGKTADFLRAYFGPYFFYTVFAGLWLGAASHSLLDWAISFIKKGK